MADEEQGVAADAIAIEAPALSVEELTVSLEPFLRRHPGTEVTRFEFAEGQINQIASPWGDHTLTLLLDDDAQPIVEVLNKVLLPKRLSAIWHINSGDVEVIWTANPLSPTWQELLGRTFHLSFGKKRYKCEFGMASEDLLTISKGIAPKLAASATAFRNLIPFSQYVNTKDAIARIQLGLDTPKSFWIRKFKLSEAALLEFIAQLNFYLSYYDRRSPTVVVHDDFDAKSNASLRYTDGKFPTEIAGRQLDDNLLTFWNAANFGNSMLRFILYYRVIEYAAFHYIDTETKARLKKLLANPAMCLNLDNAVHEVIATFDTRKMDDVPRFESLLISAVRVEKLWAEIENNRTSFSQPMKFEGGFMLDALISKDEKLSTFRTGGLVKFSVAIRKIRNVLSHGRDQNTSTAITPVERNLKMLAPWVNAIAAVAGEVVLYESVS